MSSYYTGMTMTDSSFLLENSNNQLSSSSLSYDLQTPGTSTGFNVLDDFSQDAVLLCSQQIYILY
jgi:hypothetical protein